MLEIINLSVQVGKKVILRDINLVIRKDVPAVLFGPNGSGKSTLLKAIMGFSGYQIKKGDIVFNGKKIND
jgi:Fe-S cluster assembly ATP-binding protein